MPKDRDEGFSVDAYLLRRIPAERRAAYDLLADLKFPINDRLSLEEQLDLSNLEGSEKATAEILLDTFSARDFPLASAQGTAEKFDELQIGPGPDPSDPEAPPSRPPLPIDFEEPVPEGPNIPSVPPVVWFGNDACGVVGTQQWRTSSQLQRDYFRIRDQVDACRAQIPSSISNAGECADRLSYIWAWLFVADGKNALQADEIIRASRPNIIYIVDRTPPDINPFLPPRL